MSRIHDKILLLKRKHAVRSNLVGPFSGYDRYLNDIETFIHEVAHWVTMGRDLDELSPHLESVVDSTLSEMSKSFSDSLEYDTTMITYLVGLHLGLWEQSPDMFATSCNKNLRFTPWVGTKIDAVQHTLNEFTARMNTSKDYYLKHAIAIASWLKPSCRKTFTKSTSFQLQNGAQ